VYKNNPTNPELGLLKGCAMTLHISIVVGEHSGDQLGFKLMRELKAMHNDIVFSGVGGPLMQEEGLKSLFPLSDIAVMGLVPVLKKLPMLIRKVYQTVKFIVDTKPDVLVIIDSPDFTHAVAKRVRRKLPDLPIVDYVSPSVWAWRPERAHKMRAYVNHVLALLPFEPDAHLRLNGPACTYVGHPLIERLDELRPNNAEAVRRNAQPPILLVMPGSRRSTLKKLMPVYRDTLARIVDSFGPVDAVIPAVTHLVGAIEAQIADWPVRPRVVQGEAGKYAAFRQARAALVCSGTATLELALAQVPMVVAYRVTDMEARLLRPFISAPSAVLPNLVMGRNVIPEFIHWTATADHLAPAVVNILADGPARQFQLDALAELDGVMTLSEGDTPSRRAARIVLKYRA
jgi:lipid-A-disaccharide synthase